MRRISKRAVISVILMVFLVIASYCLSRHREDQRWLAEKARQVVAQAGAHTRREQIVALRDYLRRHVKWQGAAHDGRPFLRATARETLESGLGYCGESTRAFINLAHQLGIKAQRINLHGPNPHVVAEAEVRPGVSILVDPQDSPRMNAYFDRRDWTLDEAVSDPGAPFSNYSNINLRRVPILDWFVTRIKLNNSLLTWTLENPWLIMYYINILICLSILLAFIIDRIAIRFYAHRLGVRMPWPLPPALLRRGRSEPDPMGSCPPQPARDEAIRWPASDPNQARLVS